MAPTISDYPRLALVRVGDQFFPFRGRFPVRYLAQVPPPLAPAPLPRVPPRVRVDPVGRAAQCGGVCLWRPVAAPVARLRAYRYKYPTKAYRPV